MNKELELELYGRVQGIMFRKRIRDYALASGLKGFVKNRDDGSVLVVAQGTEKKLEDFKDWVEKGPGLSKVSSLNYSWRRAVIDYGVFKILRVKGFFVDQHRAISNFFGNLFGLNKIEGEVPRHIAIIPDGNRRWAKGMGLEPTFGHYHSASYENLKSIFDEASKLGVKYMSLWGFSTENWKRDREEIGAIFEFILRNVEHFRKDAHEREIRFRHIGRKDRLPKKLASELRKLEKETAKYGKFNVNLCLDYGGRDEIISAVNKLLKSGKKKVSEKDFEKYLNTAGVPDPDLIIRTSGERRTSGLMPFQATYAELHFVDKHFPSFGASDLRYAVMDYCKRARRFGN